MVEVDMEIEMWCVLSRKLPTWDRLIRMATLVWYVLCKDNEEDSTHVFKMLI